MEEQQRFSKQSINPVRNTDKLLKCSMSAKFVRLELAE